MGGLAGRVHKGVTFWARCGHGGGEEEGVGGGGEEGVGLCAESFMGLAGGEWGDWQAEYTQVGPVT
jgi:hypothetical protein